MKIKEYFPDEELFCRCGCGAMPDERALEMIYALRLLVNFTIYVTSGSRCKLYNREAGGALSSFHISEKRDKKNDYSGSTAFDCRLENKDMLPKFIHSAYLVGFRCFGIIKYDDTGRPIIHIDSRRSDKWLLYK